MASSPHDAQWSPTTPVSPKTLPPSAPAKQKRPHALDERHPTIPSAPTVDSPASVMATKALGFVATATPPSLLALGVALSAVVYAILGRLGLLVIGAVGGVVAFVSLEARNPEIARAVSREKGTHALDRIWLHLQSTRPDADPGPDDEQAAIRVLDDLRPETRDALASLVDAVIRDYVKWWYSPIIPTDHSFPLACRKTLNSYLLAVANRLSRKRPADAFLDLLTNCSSIIIVVMSELAAAFADLPPESNMTAADAVYNYLASNPDSRLANLLNQRQQAAKFKMVAEDLLGFLDQNTQNCDAARVFLREIVANSILETTLQTCSKAEWINGWIVYLLEAGEPDLNQAIDVGMQTARDSGSNVFADIDGNVGNIGIAKPSRPSAESDHSRHKRRLSKADEKMEDTVGHTTAAGEAKAEAPKRKPTIGELDLSHSAATASAKSDPSLARSWQSDKSSVRADGDNLPPTPRSAMDSSSQGSSPQRTSGSQAFTNFEQIVPEADADDDAPAAKHLLTLHNATFTLHDDATGDGAKVRSKPTWDYLIQVEPASVSHSGWMIVRRYCDFETLHEILRRIATISGATAFTETHKELPKWKMHSRESLRGELERYLRDACWYSSLAESEGMKRFLEKSQGHTHSNSNSKSFGWDSMGKNMLDVLSTAPKGAVEGGRTLVGGVLGNFGGLAKKPPAGSLDMAPASGRLSISGAAVPASIKSPAKSERTSLDSQRSSVISTQPAKVPPMERQPSFHLAQSDVDADLGRSSRLERAETWSASPSALPSREHSRTSSLAPLRSPSTASLDLLKLPPPPDQMADDYSVADVPRPKTSDGGPLHQHHPGRRSNGAIKTPAAKPSKQYAQLSENETRVAVELLFAIINEMYTLSSAWNIRRTLLTAAKSFLLRPGNPSLLTVQSLIQKSLLDANTADSGIAASLRKLRENSLPTEDELAAWPPGLSADEKEKLAVKARKLLIQSGVPAALMGVMGQAATGEALGRVFDCLQIEEVARGLLFGLILQAVRIVTH
ncbi:hypothetical protein CDD82_3435 [Ophiocordyceps australis]|uniref:PXA domain-containing protein n=1 Tax=Ophiocordyceps australis TaxID=1399860 RepID=A0A2C5ZTF7_9HYPO|nr:hypothetical protein CDD82_3435 [Ophiocordyceps australis]